MRRIWVILATTGLRLAAIAFGAVLLVGLTASDADAQRRRRRPRARPRPPASAPAEPPTAPPTTPESSPQPTPDGEESSAPAEPPEGATPSGTSPPDEAISGGGTIEFEERVVRGERVGPGAVALFDRLERPLVPLVRPRREFVRPTVTRVLGRLAEADRLAMIDSGDEAAVAPSPSTEVAPEPQPRGRRAPRRARRRARSVRR